MKTRQGYVANSSSSSFVLAFPCMAHTLPASSLRELLYQGQESVTIGEYVHSTHEIAEHLQRWIVQNDREPIDFVADVVSSGYLPEMPKYAFPNNYSSMTDEEIRAYWKGQNEKLFRWSSAYAQKWLDSLEIESRYFYTVAFEDGAGDIERYLHDGDAFRHIPHIRISNH